MIAELVIDWQHAYDAGIMPSPPPKETIEAAADELIKSMEWTQAMLKMADEPIRWNGGSWREPLIYG